MHRAGGLIEVGKARIVRLEHQPPTVAQLSNAPLSGGRPSGVRAVMAAQCLDGQGRGGNGDSVGGCIRHRTGGGRVGGAGGTSDQTSRSEEDTSELQSLMRSSYPVLCLQKNNRRLHVPTAQQVSA